MRVHLRGEVLKCWVLSKASPRYQRLLVCNMCLCENTVSVKSAILCRLNSFPSPSHLLYLHSLGSQRMSTITLCSLDLNMDINYRQQFGFFFFGWHMQTALLIRVFTSCWIIVFAGGWCRSLPIVRVWDVSVPNQIERRTEEEFVTARVLLSLYKLYSVRPSDVRS